MSHETQDDTTCSFCLGINSQQVTITNNTFEDNYEGLLLFEKHNLPRASHIMLYGGVNSEISDNAFVNQIFTYSRLYG